MRRVAEFSPESPRSRWRMVAALYGGSLLAIGTALGLWLLLYHGTHSWDRWVSLAIVGLNSIFLLVTVTMVLFRTVRLDHSQATGHSSEH